MHDGDSVTVLRNNKQIKIRVWGIDTPELGQAFGKSAKKAASELLYDKDISFNVGDTDRYGRTISKITLPNGNDYGAVMIASGLAWHYVQYAKNEDFYAQLQSMAKRLRQGLWADAEPTAPWDWRKKK